MKISIVVNSYHSKDGRTFCAGTANPKYLEELKPVLGVFFPKSNVDIKLAKSAGCMIPQKPGIYDVEVTACWYDKRKGVAFPTIWLGADKEGHGPVFTFKGAIRERPKADKPAEPDDKKLPF